jgi:gliding motility-associated-like protein
VRNTHLDLKILLILCISFLSKDINAQLGFCQGNSGDPIFNEDFGTGIVNSSLPDGTTTYTYTSGYPDDGFYTVANGSFGNPYDWHEVEDHTPDDVDGKFLIVNADFNPGEFYRTKVSGLCETTTYEFSAWLFNFLKVPGFCVNQGIEIPVNVSFQIWDSTDTNLLASGDTGDIFATAQPTWDQYGLVFQTLPSQTEVILKMINNGVGGCGNDLAIDDIVFKSCGDLIAVEDSNNNPSVNICSSETPYSDTLTAIPDNVVFSSHFYQWQTSSDGEVWSDIAGETNEDLNIAGVNVTTYYRAKVAEFAANLNNSDCITFSDTYQITVVQGPAAPVSNGDVDFNCSLNEALLLVSVPTGISVNWYDSPTGGNLLLQNSNAYLVNDEGTYYGEAIDDITGCVSSVRTEVSSVKTNPDPPIVDGDVGINCETNEAELFASVNTDVIVNWYDAEVGGNLLLSDSVTLIATELGTYYAEAVNEITGCVSLTRTTISVLAELQTGNCIIPQGISPSVSPGFNDNFDLRNFAVTKIEIFNRNGTLVYAKDNYTNEWEGQTNDGEELPVGTYFYTMIYEGGSKSRTGWVYISK